MAQARPLSDAPRRSGSGCLVLFGLAFALFGAVFVAVFLVLPLWRVLAARGWTATPCVIQESRLGRNADSDGETWRVEVRFTYRYAGRAGGLPEAGAGAPERSSDRYDLSGGMFSSGRSGKAAIVAALPPGLRTTCWVDPGDPDQAVLVRDPTGPMWYGLLTLLFPAAGLGIAYAGWRRRRAAPPPPAGAAPPPPDPPGGSIVLRPASSRLARLAGMSLMAVFWNGIVLAIGWAALWPAWQRGEREWTAAVFLAIFALVGLGLLAAAGYQLLALANPRLLLTVDRRRLRAGDRLQVSWECRGDARRLTGLRIAIEGVEEATYTRGTTTQTDTRVFAAIPLAEVADAVDIAAGRAQAAIPAGSMPSFAAPHNRIHWRLVVRGSIPRWPDVSDDYALEVVP